MAGGEDDQADPEGILLGAERRLQPSLMRWRLEPAPDPNE